MAQIIAAVKARILHILNPHCPDCSGCENCDRLERLLIGCRSDYNSLLESYKELVNKPTEKPEEPEQVNFEPIIKHVPWAIRKRELEKADAARAVLLRNSDSVKTIEELESQLGVK